MARQSKECLGLDEMVLFDLSRMDVLFMHPPFKPFPMMRFS
jgi:hypothetical protein